jgi:Arylsulfotransferase (ASST)
MFPKSAKVAGVGERMGLFRTGAAAPRGTNRCVALGSVLLAGLCLAVALSAQSLAATAPRPSFSTTPALSPGFSWAVHDYVVRCTGDPVSIQVSTPGTWRGKVGAGSFRSDNFTTQRSLTAGHSFTVIFQNAGAAKQYRFHVRCLPSDFPNYRFARTGAGGPGFFVVQMNNNYAAIFNGDGVPVWWYKASTSPLDAEILPDGTISWQRFTGGGTAGGGFEIHKLNGQLVRTVVAAGGLATDIHEIVLLPNGDYMIGAIIRKPHQDATPYGGSSDATYNTYEIQELTPDGQLVWKWDTLKHIGPDQTPQRWWDQVLGGGQPALDIQHFNAADPHGKFVYLSFRHLDAVYKINRNTGAIIWKLGGIHTSKSLRVLNDPEGSYPLGGQHDVRLWPDGTLSIFDNNTGLGRHPRVVRYQIDEKAKTAKLVESFEDRTATTSPCCGSARRLPGGGWLVSWGGLKFSGAYNAKDKNAFRLQYPGGFSYRSFPVPPHALTAQRLRGAMNALNP